MKCSAPRRRLGSQLETLEDRTLPTTFGIPWADPEHLTLSFVADGTQTPIGTSSLSAELAQAGSSAAWQQEILRGFQTWAMQTNIDIGLVADGGQALGTIGAVQSDSRFGDIRIAAAPLSAESLASTSPFSWTGTTLSGDMILNSSAQFTLGGSTGYDLFSVALHEAGHAFGLAHANEEGGPCGCSACAGLRSVMEAAYARQTSLATEDIAAIRALYGTREADAFDAASSNDAIWKASSLPKMSNGQFLAIGDMTTLSDVDFYKFRTPLLTASLSGVHVRLKAAGISLLTAKVTVYNSFGRVVGSDQSVDPLNNDLIVSFRPGLFGGNYFVKVEGAQENAFGVGGYKLAVDFLSLGGILAPITTTLGAVLDGGTNDLLANALGISSNNSSDARFDAVYRGVIESANDVDNYRVRTSSISSGTSVTLNVMVWGLDANPVDPQVRVFDADGQAVAFQVLSNDRGLFSIQVLNTVAGQDYYIQVSARNPGGANSTGSYFLAADFNRLTPLVFDGVAAGTVAPSSTEEATLELSEAGVFQFALGATSEQAGAEVTMAVYDENGQLVFKLTAVAGKPPVTATRYLTAGTYSVRYSVAATNTSSVSFGLFMLQLSEGVGPYATSTSSPPPSESPPTSPPPPPPPSEPEPSYSYSGSSTSEPSGYWYWY
ncbi:MAG: matrixin family metalloprotease [Planctomycetia bacterium]|nr:matrixin family metalloprotease [Planctomycetia bacterium]